MQEDTCVAGPESQEELGSPRQSFCHVAITLAHYTVFSMQLLCLGSKTDH